MKVWPRVEPTTVTQVGWRYVTSKHFVQPDGQIAEYTTYGTEGDRHGAVVALTTEGTVVLAEQFRPGPEMVVSDLPGGGINQDEEPLDGVMRELKEETGYTSEEVTFLGTMRKDAYMNATWYYFLAKDCVKEYEPTLDEGEFVDVRLVSVPNLIAAAKEGVIGDAHAVWLAQDTLEAIHKEGGNHETTN